MKLIGQKQSPIQKAMLILRKFSFLRGAKILITAVIIGLVLGFLPVFGATKIEQNNQISLSEEEILSEIENSLVVLQDNSLSSIASDYLPPQKQVTNRIRVVITAYSSTIWQTDGDPFTTASGSTVENGTIANNSLPFGTKVKIPALYGDKIFTVTDRMNSRWPDNKFDIWFESTSEARKFGIKNTYIEILKI